MDKLQKEYDEFMGSDAPHPSGMRNEIARTVHRDLKRFPMIVFLKALAIHACVGTFTLLFCPQFGVGPLGGEFGVMEFLMGAGPVACTIACAAIFLGFSGLFTSLALNRGESGYLQKNRILIYSALALASLILLNAMGSQSWGLHFNLLWVTAAIFFACLTTSFGRFIKLNIS